MRKEKKAISTIIATVLLILITIAAVGILWQVVMPLIQGTTQTSQACMNARLEIAEGGYTCFDSTPNELQVRVSRASDDTEIVGILISVSSEGKTNAYEVIGGKTSTNVKVYGGEYEDVLEVPGINEEQTYVISGITSAENVKIAPIVKVGKVQKTCDITATADIVECE